MQGLPRPEGALSGATGGGQCPAGTATGGPPPPQPPPAALNLEPAGQQPSPTPAAGQAQEQGPEPMAVQGRVPLHNTPPGGNAAAALPPPSTAHLSLRERPPLPPPSRQQLGPAAPMQAPTRAAAGPADAAGAAAAEPAGAPGGEGEGAWAPAAMPPTRDEVDAQLEELGARRLFEKVGASSFTRWTAPRVCALHFPGRQRLQVLVSHASSQQAHPNPCWLPLRSRC